MHKQLLSELISFTEAGRLIGVSRVKIAQLVKDGHLRVFPSILDKRSKLVRRDDVLELLRKEQAA